MERSVRAILRAETGQFEAGMGRAAKATEQVGTAAETASRKTRQSTHEQTTAARSFSQNLVKSARENEQAWTQVGTSLAVVGGVTTALMGTVLATGISYNQLRQSSVAALTTLTGSAQAANAQMDRLDDFASNSPFARDVFIRAQQQMLGFGIEAEKVVPYLDAIQNAVAAAGGSNHDIAELTRIFSQVRAASKITATDLMQFGQRGVDAATLIGSQMGMTGAQIREEITAGTLDANQALDALAAGMATTFDGAAAGVKDTFAGAVDRVKAAFRDVSSIVAEPLVGREGGGLFTGLLNQIADFLRMIEDIPAPILQIGGMLTGLGGLAALAAGGFMVLAPRIVETIDAASRLGLDVSGLQDSFRRLSPHVGTAVVAVGKFGAAATAAATGVLLAKQVADAIAGFNDAAPAVENLTRRLQSLSSEMSGYDAILGDMDLAGFTTLEEAVAKLTNMSAFDQFLHNMGIAADRSHVASEGLEQAGRALAALAETDVDAAAESFAKLAMEAGGTDQAAIDLLNTMPAFRSHLEGVALEMGLATDDATLLKLALGYIAPEAESAAAAVHGFEGALSGYAAAQEGALERLHEWQEMVTEADSAFSDIAGAYQQVIDANRSLAEETAAATESSKDSWEDYYDGATVSMDAWIAKLEEQAEAQANWQANILASTEQIRDELPANMQAAADAMLDELIALGPEGAAAIATFTDASAEEKQRLIEAWLGTGEQIADDFAAELENARRPELDVDTVPAEEALAAFFGALANGEEVVVIDGDATPVEDVLSALRNTISTFDEPMPINGDDVPVMDVLNAVSQAIANEEEDVTINGNRLPVDQVVGTLMAWIRQQEAAVNVSANTSVAMSRLNALDATLNRINGKTVTATVALAQTGNAAVASGGYMGDFLAGGGRPRKRYTMGGEVFGPGSTTSDDVPAMLSRKEFVQRAAAVDYYGVDTMYALNNMRIPRERLLAGLSGGGQLRDALGGGRSSIAGHSVPVPASLPKAAVLSSAGAQFTANLYGVQMDATERVAADVLFSMRRFANQTGFAGGLDA